VPSSADAQKPGGMNLSYRQFFDGHAESPKIRNLEQLRPWANDPKDVACLHDAIPDPHYG